MRKSDINLNERYKSRLFPDRHDYTYEVIAINKKTCNVRLWIDDKPTETIYRQVPYAKLY